MIEAEWAFYMQQNASIRQGAHSLPVDATDAFDEARRTVAASVGAGEEEMVWASNTTSWATGHGSTDREGADRFDRLRWPRHTRPHLSVSGDQAIAVRVGITAPNLRTAAWG